MSVTTQKDYLKKYLSIGKDSTEKKKKKKKKVKSNTAASRLVIIDDNADTFENAVKEDLLEDEDAPQIVAVIDDRPPSLRVDEKNNTNLWIPIGSNNVNSLESTSSSSKNGQNLGDLSPPRNRIKLFSKKNEDMSSPRRQSSSVKYNSDKILDKRFKIKEENEDMSPPRKNSDKIIDDKIIKIKEENEDMSPPRKNSSTLLRTSKKGKQSRWGEEGPDVSPTRYNSVNKNEQNKKYDDDNSPPRKRSQVSSPRKLNKENFSRRMSNDEDMSPPRKRTKDTYQEKLNKENSSGRISNDYDKKIDDDMSPPRKRTKDTYSEKGNKKKSSRWESEEVSSSASRHDKDKTKNKYGAEDNSPPRKKSEISHSTKMMKTLDGKTAGLQNAKQLAAETTLIKEKERDLFNQMSSEMSGANATTIVRDKKTGRVRNFQEEAARDLEKKKREEENKEKYSRWGRGLKQVEDATKRRDEELNEMNKPLARYANDEDLERYLKEQEREGDPMLAYIRKKKKKKDVEEGKPMKPEYMGEFMPNRFGIRPGHRWDGVDRSNGYEKKWFDIQNSRMAQQEEAYKWSTEDM